MQRGTWQAEHACAHASQGAFTVKLDGLHMSLCLPIIILLGTMQLGGCKGNSWGGESKLGAVDDRPRQKKKKQNSTSRGIPR